MTEFDLAVRLTVVPSESEAEAVRGLLRVNGIACRQRSAGHAEMLGSWWHEVLVAPHQLDGGASAVGFRRGYAAAVASPRSGRYCRQPVGIFGVARRM